MGLCTVFYVQYEDYGDTEQCKLCVFMFSEAQLYKKLLLIVPDCLNMLPYQSQNKHDWT